MSCGLIINVVFYHVLLPVFSAYTYCFVLCSSTALIIAAINVQINICECVFMQILNKQPIDCDGQLAAQLCKHFLRWPTNTINLLWLTLFLPHCIECRRGLAMRILFVYPSVRPSVRLSVCLSPSVRPSLCHTRELWTVERSVQIFIPYERSFSLIYWEEEFSDFDLIISQWLKVSVKYCLPVRVFYFWRKL